MRKKLRRGGGEFIGFAIGMLGLCTMILPVNPATVLPEA